MKIAIFSTHPFDIPCYEEANKQYDYELDFFTENLDEQTIDKVNHHDVVACFACDDLSAPILEALHNKGIRMVALRSAGYNHVDLDAAKALNIQVARVPAYSPHAIAEHAIGLMLCLIRKIHQAHNMVQVHNYCINDLIGFDLYKKTVGIIGTGHIGSIIAKILRGFGCKVLAYDIFENQSCIDAGVEYVSFDKLLSESRIISLHCPLNEQTKHMIDKEAFSKIKADSIIINTARGGVIDTDALIDALKANTIAGVAMDVYEYEGGVFFHDMREQALDDKRLDFLQAQANVLITPHQAFLTHEAISNIASTTLENIHYLEQGNISPNAL